MHDKEQRHGFRSNRNIARYVRRYVPFFEYQWFLRILARVKPIYFSNQHNVTQ